MGDHGGLDCFMSRFLGSTVAIAESCCRASRNAELKKEKQEMSGPLGRFLTRGALMDKAPSKVQM